MKFIKDSINGMEKSDVALTADKVAADKVAADKVAADKVAADKVAADKVAADKVAADKVAADKVAADKAVADKAVADKAVADKAVADKAVADKAVADKAVADKAVADKAVADKVVADKVVADKVAADKVAAKSQLTDTSVSDRQKIVASLPIAISKSIKRTDGKIEIILKNGASFIGKIISENERIVRFESDGTVINIIRQLIKELDGVPFDTKSAIVWDSLPSRHDNYTSKTSASSAAADTAPDLRRAFPDITLPQGITVSQLIDSMHSSNWETRSHSARLVATTGQWGTEAIPFLKLLLADSVMSSSYEPIWIDSSNVKELLVPGDEASRALSRMGDAGFNALSMLCKDTSALVRRRAAFGMGELSHNRAWSILKEMLKDTDRGVRAVSVTGLRSAQFVDIIITMLRDEDTEVRADAAFMLGKLRDKEAIKPLRSLLFDKRSIVRAQAAAALCSIGGPEAIKQLINASKDAAISVRENAAFALGETGDSIAVQPLISLLRDKIISVRIAAIDALAQIRDPRAIPSLYSMMKDGDPEVHEHARLSLRKHTDIQSLIDALGNPHSNVQENVLYMLWLLTGQSFGLDKKQWQDWYGNSVEMQQLTDKK